MKNASSHRVSRSTPHGNPYVGLRPYEREERHIFKGRERDATLLCNKIFSARLTLLYALSGVGKSSLLRTLIIPDLEDQKARAIYFCNWAGEDPTGTLKAKLIKIATDVGISDAAAGSPTVADLVRLLVSVEGHTVVLILDQFEEFLVEHGQRLDPLRKELGALVRAENLDCRVVISLRQEFLASLEPFRNEILNLFHSTYLLQHLDDKSARAAIVEPANLFGKSYEANKDNDLVKQLLRDLRTKPETGKESGADQPVELPILQLVCSKLWEAAKQESLITLKLYEKLGGTQNILDAYIREKMPKGWFNRQLTARLMKRLAPPSGYKMSYSVDDLATENKFSRFYKNRIHNELKRLADPKLRVLHTFPYKGAERFELSHDFLIKIVRPWYEEVLTDVRIFKYALIISIVLFVVWIGFYEWQQKKMQDSRTLAITAISKLKEDPQLGLLLALHATERFKTADAMDALHVAVNVISKRFLFSPYGAAITSIALDREGTMLAIASPGERLTEEGRKQIRISVWAIPITGPAQWLPVTETKITRTKVTKTKVTKTKVAKIEEAETKVLKVAFHSAESHLAVASSDGTVVRWNAISQAPQLAGSSEPSKPAKYSDPSKITKTLLHELSVKLSELYPHSSPVINKVILKRPEGIKRSLVAATFTQDLGVLATVELNAREQIERKEIINTKEAYTKTVEEYRVRTWNARTGDLNPIDFPLIPTSNLINLVFSQNGDRLALGSEDGTVIILDAHTGKIHLRTSILEKSGDKLLAIDITSDGGLLVTGGSDGTVRLWDGNTGKQKKEFQSHSKEIRSVSFSPKGTKVVGGGSDGIVTVWDVQTYDTALSVDAHSDGVSGLAFSQNEKILASAGWDGDFFIYPLDYEAARKQAVALVFRPLTPKECTKYLHEESCPELGISEPAIPSQTSP